MTDHPPPWNPPLPPGTHLPAQHDVTPAMSAFAVEVVRDHANYPMHSVTPQRTIDGRRVCARVVWHTKQAATGRTGLFWAAEILFVDGPPRAEDGDGPETERMPTSGPARGCDVSDFQPHVDWAAVAASGIGFVFVKAQEGVTLHAQLLGSHWGGAGSAGLQRSAYHFFRTTSDPREQIRVFLADVAAVEAEHGVHELPLAIDVEAQHQGDVAAQLGGLTPDAFLDRVEAAVDEFVKLRGTPPVIYCGPGLWNLLPRRGNVEARCALWLADYTPPATLPGMWLKWTFWQTSDRQPIPGIGPCDVNIFNGTLAELRAWAFGGNVDVAPEWLWHVAADIDAGREGLP